jgi:hypothetical protein
MSAKPKKRIVPTLVSQALATNTNTNAVNKRWPQKDEIDEMHLRNEVKDMCVNNDRLYQS